MPTGRIQGLEGTQIMDFNLFNSYLEIDLNILRNNIRSIRSSLPEATQIIPVLKRDAYGLGALPVARALISSLPIDIIALAQIGEGVRLRQGGITQRLLILGAYPDSQVPAAVEHTLELSVFRPETIRLIDREAARQGKIMNVQIKIETGLNRTGAKPGEELAALAEAIKACEHIKVSGAFSHFIEGELPDDPLSRRQLALYLGALEQLERAGIPVPLRHICDSEASDWFSDAYLDALRLGRRLYMDSLDHPHAPGLPGAVEECVSWRTSILSLRRIEAGETACYGTSFRAEAPTEIAIIGVGYGDGLYEGFVEAGSPLLVRGQRARYIGMCMDQSFIDVTGLGCRIGDEVTLFGRAGDGSCLPSQELAASIGQEGVYLTSRLGPRVARHYIG